MSCLKYPEIVLFSASSGRNSFLHGGRKIDWGSIVNNFGLDSVCAEFYGLHTGIILNLSSSKTG